MAPVRRRRVRRAAIWPVLRASKSAASSTMPPRAALTSTRLGFARASCSAPISPTVSAVLRQVDADEVGLVEQLLEAHHAHTHLRGPAGLDVGVVGDHAHSEGAQPLRDEHPDPAEPDDAHGLLVELDPGVARTLPLAVAQGGVRRADVASRGEHERHRELRGADDVGGRGVDHHHAALGRGADVDVVEAHAGAGDDLEPPGRGERLGVDLGGAAHQDRVGVGDRGQEGRAVGAVAVPDLEVRPERVDRGGAELFGDQDDGPRAVASGDWVTKEVLTCWDPGGRCTTLCPSWTLPDADTP